MGEVDLVIVLVKATVTEQAMEGQKALSEKTTKSSPFPRMGWAISEKLMKVVGKEKVLAGVTEHGAICFPGRVQHADRGHNHRRT
ncbi:2-dehydropantoate 2-reductase N-terminal domain-containing protein [Acetomicrobium sp.]|uniref:2-dehydropantoate 2-reductase N-terminal domain-containing protein n=1 Tax=Acetomicrobium sp. TaxID=1872099 RepID=UPI002FC9AAE9